MRKFILLCFLWAGTAQAQVALQYDPTGPHLDTDPVVPSNVVGNIAASDLSQNNPDGLGNADVWPVNAPGAFDPQEFITFTVAPSNGQTLNLESLSYDARSYGDSNITLRLRSSLDGFASDLATANSTANGFRDWNATFDLTGLPRNYPQEIELRIYPDNAGPAADFVDLRSTAAGGGGLQLLGSAQPFSVPSLSSWGLWLMSLSILAIGFVALRRTL